MDVEAHRMYITILFVHKQNHPTVVTNVKLMPSPKADDVAVTISQSLMPCRDR